MSAGTDRGDNALEERSAGDLLTAPSEDGVAMADEVIQDNIITLLLAGHDSTSIALTLVLNYLHLHPHCLSKLIQEQRRIVEEKKGAPLDWNDTRRMKYTWQVAQETLRVQPPTIAGFRAALQDFQYAGYSVLKGWKGFTRLLHALGFELKKIQGRVE